MKKSKLPVYIGIGVCFVLLVALVVIEKMYPQGGIAMLSAMFGA